MKLKLVHVVAMPFPANQGTAATIRELIYALYKRGHEIHVVTYYEGQDIPLPEIQVYRIPRFVKRRDRPFVGFDKTRPFSDLILMFKALQVVLKVRPHIIHAHHHEGAFAAFLSRLITRTPMVYHCMASMEEELPLYIRPKFITSRLGRFLDSLIPRLSNYSVAVSEDLADNIRKSGFPKASYLPMIVDTSTIIGGNGTEFRRRYDINNNPIVLYTGVIDEFQGIDNLLKSMTIITKEMPSAKLILAASIPNEIQFNKQVALALELGLRNNIVFLESFPFHELIHLIAASDVTVIPRGECAGFPMKLLNYMAAGKPVVAMRGSAKILEDGENGLVADTWEELGEKILILLKNKELSRKLGEAGRLELDKFAPDVVAEKMEQIYISLLKHNT